MNEVDTIDSPFIVDEALVDTPAVPPMPRMGTTEFSKKVEAFRREAEKNRLNALKPPPKEPVPKKIKTERAKRAQIERDLTSYEQAAADVRKAVPRGAKGSTKENRKRLVDHIAKKIGRQDQDIAPRRPSKIDWSKVVGGSLDRYKAGWVWVPTGSTIDRELPKYPHIPESGWGVYAPPEIYAGVNNADQYIETDEDRAYTESEREASAALGGVNPREILTDRSRDTDDNVFRRTLKPFMPELLVATIAVARGVCIGEINEDGVPVKLYQIPPDKELLKYLNDQYYGRSAARKDALGDEGADTVRLEVVGYDG